MKNYFPVLILALLAVSCGKEGQVRQQDLPMAKITLLTGKATVQSGGQSKDAAVGDVIQKGDKLVTGEASQVEIFIKGQGIVRMQEKTELSLDSLVENQKTEVSVQSGSAGFFLKKLERSGDFTVRAPTAIAGVRGTAFLVSANGGTSKISLYGGAVQVKNSAGKEIIIDKPGEISVKKDSEFNEKAIQPLSKESLDSLKDLAVFQKSNIMEYNSLIDEIKTNELIQKIEASETASGRMNDDSRRGDTPAERARRADENAISRDTRKDPLKLKPNQSF